MTTKPNTRPCGACRNLDSRLRNGQAYCWARYEFRDPQATVADCDKSARPDGNPPPGQIRFRGER